MPFSCVKWTRQCWLWVCAGNSISPPSPVPLSQSCTSCFYRYTHKGKKEEKRKLISSFFFVCSFINFYLGRLPICFGCVIAVFRISRYDDDATQKLHLQRVLCLFISFRGVFFFFCFLVFVLAIRWTTHDTLGTTWTIAEND